ncbi:ATP-binding protein [Pseudomonas moorei]|nr:ATP-binding protein [Pseudomonas moorei]
MDLTAVAVKFMASVGRMLSPKAKQIYQERAAAANPEAVEADIAERTLDDTLGRLGVTHPDDPWWETFLASLSGLAVRTEFLKLPHVQKWLNQPDTQRRLKDAAKAKMAGGEPAKEDFSALIQSYIAISMESPQYAISAITSIVAVLVASVLATVRDTGVAAIVQTSYRQILIELTGQIDTLRQPNQPQQVLESEEDLLARWREELRRTSHDLLDWPTTLRDERWIHRPELDELIELVKNTTSSTTAILGPPGAGKSALMAELGKQIQNEHGLTVLAIKADLLDVGVTDELELQRYLDLSALPSTMLKRLSEHGPVILIIDQLDALASYLDMQTERLSTLINLVRQVGKTNNLHVVLTSRPFEFDHDARLRSIDTKSIRLALPSWEEVLEILKANGVDAIGWPADAQEVMRSPQALNTYLSLKAEGWSQPFTTYQGMLDQLWEQRVLNGEGGPKKSILAYQIANKMASGETLWLASSRFDEHADAVKVLIAAGILKKSLEGSLGFSHQTLFEYALARHFAQEEGRLSSYILKRQNSLFVRAKLWAALNYLRTREMTLYISEFEAIWTAKELRKHLRFLLIDFLGQQASPTDKEALLLAQALRNQHERALVYKAISGSDGWFLRFADSYIADAMTERETAAKLMIPILASAMINNPEAVTRLIGTWWISNKLNDQCTWNVLRNAPVWSDELLAFGKIVVTRSKFSVLYIDPVIASLGASQPQMALELVRTVLDRQLDRAIEKSKEMSAITRTSSEPEEMLIHDRRNERKIINEVLDEALWDSLPALAESVPVPFLETLWPWFLRVYDTLHSFSSEETPNLGYSLRFESNFRFSGENGNLEPTALLEALTIAVVKTVNADLVKFREWVAVEKKREFSPVQRLIAYGLASGAPNTSSDALDFLVSDVRRFYLGSPLDPHSTTRALVVACAPHWSDENVLRYESAVTEFRPALPSHMMDPSQRRQWSQLIRRLKVNLLRALPTRQRSAPIQRRVDEETRLFPVVKLDAGVTLLRVDSIMTSEEIGRATDDHVLNAFRGIPDSTNWEHPKHRGQGGNVQLARAFAEFAKTEPARAKHLIMQLPTDSAERTASYSLRGLAESTSPEIVCDLIVGLSRKGFKGGEFQNYATAAIDKLIERTIPVSDEVVEVLENWLKAVIEDSPVLLGASDLDDQEDEPQDSSYDDTAVKSLLWGAGRIRAVPQGSYSIVSSLILLYLSRKEESRVIDILENYLAHSADPQVWEHLLYFIQYLQSSDSERGRIVKAILEQVPQLVGKPDTAQLLSVVQWYAPEVVQSNLIKWRSSPSKVANQGYGELTALIAMCQPDLIWPRQWLKEIETDGSLMNARAGAAMTAIMLWSNPEYRLMATELLTNLLGTGERGVWVAVFDLFRIVKQLPPGRQTTQLLEAIAKNIGAAPSINGTFVVVGLNSVLPENAELVGEIAEGLVKIWQEKLSDFSTSIAMSAPELINLATTLHRLGSITQEQGLTLFEQLTELDAYEARNTLNEIDNRFRESRSIAPQRLRRRSEIHTEARSKV